MGWDQRELHVSALVSRHNSAADERDDALWSQLWDRIRAIVEEEQFTVIFANLR